MPWYKGCCTLRYTREPSERSSMSIQPIPLTTTLSVTLRILKSLRPWTTRCCLSSLDLCGHPNFRFYDSALPSIEILRLAWIQLSYEGYRLWKSSLRASKDRIILENSQANALGCFYCLASSETSGV
ncbi:hypothetical protein HZH66_010544 [Vespula vulgaris]|uniref:Uncharacterized protein n=1 Tax=Vespula vulgaris TaxID=7454 RepID=A0A834JIJ3_VESVU|nr:hypothetical protein HZH66_010544 [Vespula vulgaris]